MWYWLHEQKVALEVMALGKYSFPVTQQQVVKQRTINDATTNTSMLNYE
jgi:hypothetical protein